MVQAFSCVKGKDLACFPDLLVRDQWTKLSLENYSQQILTCDDTKDRYSLRLVYEHSRVKIQPESSYINANYVLHKQYIASQAPLPHTFGQFYDMVWQENVSVVVMLTKLEESQRCKAHRYWPTSCRPIKYFGDDDIKENRWKVELIEKDAIDCDILIRTLCVTLIETGENRTITQIQYTGWPDHGCPSEIHSIAAVLHTVNNNHRNGPLLVHCSAGIGRTGTFIAIRHELERAINLFRQYAQFFDGTSSFEKIDAMQAFLQNHNFSICETVHKMRKDRKMMVQRREQLKFCFDFFSYLSDDENKENEWLEEHIVPLFFPQNPNSSTSPNPSPLFTFP